MATTESKKYIEGIGRRKEAVARVRIISGKGNFVVNDLKLTEYFSLPRYQKMAEAPFGKLEGDTAWDVSVHVSGGGKSAQAEAIRLGLSRALVEHDSELRTPFKKEGFLKRDPRVKERKKFGLKKARKSPQWSKR